MMALPPDVTRPAQVARALTRWMGAAPDRSPFLQAAMHYCHRPLVEEASAPMMFGTTYEPAWAALFEAMLELAFLVLGAKGPLTTEAKDAFLSAVVGAFDPWGRETFLLTPHQVDALLADMEEQRADDGAEKRVRMVVRTVTHANHQSEALRIAAMMAHLLGPASALSREALESFARGFGLDRAAADEALREAERSLADASG